MRRSLVLITVGHLKPGETSGRPGLSPVRVLLGPTKHCTCDKDPPLVKSSLWPLPTGRRLIFISVGGHRDGTAGRAAPPPALTTSVSFSHTPAAVTQQTRHMPDEHAGRETRSRHPGQRRLPSCRRRRSLRRSLAKNKLAKLRLKTTEDKRPRS